MIHRSPTTALFALLLASQPVAAEGDAVPQPVTKPTTAPINQAATEQPTEPLVKKISADIYQIGRVTFNKTTREISLPAHSNLLEAGTPLEFLLVHLNGEKVHESLLVTETDPTNLNIALKLLNYKESQELFKPLLADGSRAEKEHVVADDIRKAARFTIHVSWKENGQKKSVPITQWLQHSVTGKPMPIIPWVYSGSYMHRNRFKAKVNGNIFALLTNESAIANYPGADRHDDTLWLSPKNMAPEDTPITITITIKPWNGEL